MQAPTVDATSLAPHTLRANLLGNDPVECYYWHTATPGTSLFFEQRSWLQSLGFRDGVEYRKRQRGDNTLENVAAEWQPLTPAFEHGRQEGMAMRTTIMRTDMM